ncbi:hypothetical protein ACFFKE_29905 [Streptomyces mutabilis]|uniref:hypothetical protein n=1 Tax=Streptomyces mutabilis TaxID=67332 RepID=UPI0019970D84|nr:hypothetical protein [Streptomyces mutabilis]GGQ42631.1 hypothetical protein GCM10010279_60640 [Streptomyces mutabilis]
MGGRLLRSAEEHEDVPAQRAAGAVLIAVGVTGTALMPKAASPHSRPSGASCCAARRAAEPGQRTTSKTCFCRPLA